MSHISESAVLMESKTQPKGVDIYLLLIGGGNFAYRSVNLFIENYRSPV